jgi:hypothetical protein
MRKTSSLYILPAVISAYYIVHSLFFHKGLGHVDASAVLSGTGLIFLYAYALLFILVRLRRSVTAPLAASLILVSTLFYISLRDALTANSVVNAVIQNIFWNKNNTFFIFLAVSVSWALLRFVKSSPPRAATTGTILILFFFVLGGLDISNYYRNQPKTAVVPSVSPDAIRFTTEKPDVYFLLFDSETSPASLKKYWGYAGDSIEQQLAARGFFIAHRSKSNYNWTAYSVCSTLNMSYMVDNTPLATNEDFPDSINSTVVKIFTNNGYTVRNLSFFGVETFPCLYPFNEFNLWDKTVFYFLYDRMTGYTYREFARRQRNQLHATEDTLSSIIARDEKQPKFVYAHFFMPHPPAYITRDGKEIPGGSMDNQNMGLYLDQVLYSYDLMLRLTDRIQAASKGKAIIIMLGDHGYRYLVGPQKMDEQFDVFKAVYFPDKNYTSFSDSTTSVNTFRIVLNKEFGTSLPMVRDSFHNVFINTLRILP